VAKCIELNGLNWFLVWGSLQRTATVFCIRWDLHVESRDFPNLWFDVEQFIAGRAPVLSASQQQQSNENSVNGGLKLEAIRYVLHDVY